MVSRIERVVSGKEKIFLRGNASYLYSTIVTTRGPRRKPRERSGFLKDDSNSFREIPSTRESLWEGFPKVIKLLESVRLEFVESEHCIPVLATEFKLSKATSGNTLWLRTQSGA